MPTYLAPAVYVEERSTGARPIAGVSTSTAAFVGVTERGPVGRATLVTSFAEFVKRFGGPIPIIPGSSEHYLYYSVRHFFDLGGTRCYVVRVAHYNNISDPTTLTAVPATATFPGQQLNGAAVANALQVAAISPGTWGTALQVEVISSSRFQLRLASSIAAGNATAIDLVRNTEVVRGSVLYLVHEIAGVVGSVNTTTNSVDFAGPLLQSGAPSTASIATGAVAFTPDFSAATSTNLAAALNLNTANPPASGAMVLTSVAGLSPGSALHFVVDAALVVVLSVEQTTSGGTPITRAVIAPVATPIALPTLPQTGTTVYARDFGLRVRLNGDVIESHSNLSLAATNTADYVNDRLGPDSGASEYIVATEPSAATADNIVMPNVGFTALAGSASDGLANLSVTDFAGSVLARNGLHALDPIEDASILVVPPSRITSAAIPLPLTHQQNLTGAIITYVDGRRDMFYIMDPPPPSGDQVQAVRTFRGNFSSSYAGIYFPWLRVGHPVTNQRLSVPPSGAVAGVFARSDVRRGVHKAPAGTDVGILSVAAGVAHMVTRGQNDILYPENINAIRNLREGIVVWGSRTISADPLWQQVSIRRLFIFLERSIEVSTQWTVFEPNDPSLWKTIERTIKGFLRIQWLEGKLVGDSEEQAFFVRCNAETNPPEVVDAGQVVTEIGVAPSRPAEFVVFRIRQFAGRVG
ncbi:MAG: phage tail sheath subtilisin-like domain-containing protein [Acidobacteria bacterium]|nr:phage tail sheath subtilisin-like domain-containing protein [Acidobacteriota bacterium]